MDEKRYNVIEIMAPHPKAGKIVVTPVRRRTSSRRPLPLRNARWRLSNSTFEFADGFACGLMSEKRNDGSCEAPKR
jgi:hypothetical protein